MKKKIEFVYGIKRSKKDEKEKENDEAFLSFSENFFFLKFILLIYSSFHTDTMNTVRQKVYLCVCKYTTTVSHRG